MDLANMNQTASPVQPHCAVLSQPDPLQVGGVSLNSRLFLGTARYPAPSVLAGAVQAAQVEVLTVSLRRLAPESQSGQAWWQRIREMGRHLLPNTAGCHSAEEAITVAQMAREIFGTHWIKLEVIGDDYTLQPDPWGTVAAAQTLVREGFAVFAYTTDDLVTALKLRDAGVAAIMPWAAPIGTGAGPRNLPALRTLRERLPDSVLVVDAGIGAPHHAAQVMELGYDAVLVNTAVAEAGDPVAMARAFTLSVQAGRLAHCALPMRTREVAQASTPMVGVPFWHQGS
ncbi:MAG TPA: thiazole synthase [Thiomonas arsenitoxydans]|jgi:thiazole synthase|uniref:Thiazole synthase n=1 Tax=Thiomonas intermedia (strain K12) TaxID=75379 RepID=D5X0K5_THIK1|nr:thiazole synthase [Thiomonas sp.]HOI65594.1 thiazole synthase [Thiomonas arsenitoxydans]